MQSPPLSVRIRMIDRKKNKVEGRGWQANSSQGLGLMYSIKQTQILVSNKDTF